MSSPYAHWQVYWRRTCPVLAVDCKTRGNWRVGSWAERQSSPSRRRPPVWRRYPLETLCRADRIHRWSARKPDQCWNPDTKLVWIEPEICNTWTSCCGWASTFGPLCPWWCASYVRTDPISWKALAYECTCRRRSSAGISRDCSGRGSTPALILSSALDCCTSRWNYPSNKCKCNRFKYKHFMTLSFVRCRAREIAKERERERRHSKCWKSNFVFRSNNAIIASGDAKSPVTS